MPENKFGQLPQSQLHFKLNLYSNRPQTADGCRWMELQRCYSGAIGGAIGGAAQPLNWAMTSKLTATAATACRWMLHHRTPSDNQQTVGLTPTAHWSPNLSPNPRLLLVPLLFLLLLVNYFSRPTQLLLAAVQAYNFPHITLSKKKNTWQLRNRFKWIYQRLAGLLSSN